MNEKLRLIFKKIWQKKIIFFIALALLIGGSAMAARWLKIGYSKPINPGSLIEATDINEMACELVFMCGHDCGYTINQRFGCSGQYYGSYKTIRADSWAFSGNCDHFGCQCSGGNCQTSGPVHAGDPVTAEDINRIIASIKNRANGWCTIGDPEISNLTFVSVGDIITASKMNEVRDALDYLSAQQNQCSGGPKCYPIKYFDSDQEIMCKNMTYSCVTHGCCRGHCAKCDDGRWVYIKCEDDPVGFGPCNPPGIKIWPPCSY